MTFVKHLPYLISILQSCVQITVKSLRKFESLKKKKKTFLLIFHSSFADNILTFADREIEFWGQALSHTLSIKEIIMARCL